MPEYTVSPAARNRIRLPNRRNAETAIVTTISTLDAQQWWAIESARIGTDWPGILKLHFEICDRLRAAHSSMWVLSS
jgi:hypothetical protein